MKSSVSTPLPIRIGLLSSEPIRLAGLASIFDSPSQPGKPQFVPASGSQHDLLANPDIEYLIADLYSVSGSLQMLENIRQYRPDLRLIVIGPDNDELILGAIMAGARAYLDFAADPALIRKAIEEVAGGSIWAPRRLLSLLIDRLLQVPVKTSATVNPQLTPREQQVLELILMAHSTREIASRLGIEQRTVKAYVGRLMHKTGSNNRIKLSLSALNHSLLPQLCDPKSVTGKLIGNITRQ
jgi:DNA-binding NarL/FixJ family response regulator